MRRAILSERTLVVVLFVMVVVIFSFAQADARRIEKMYFNSELPVTTSFDQQAHRDAALKTPEKSAVIHASQFR